MSVDPSPNPSDDPALTQLLALSKRATPGPWESWSVHRTSRVRGKPGHIKVHAEEEPVHFPIWRTHTDDAGRRVHTPIADPCVVGGTKPASEHFAQAKANAEFIVAAVNYIRSLESKSGDGLT